MSMKKALEELRQETLSEMGVFYAKPTGSKIDHIFYLLEPDTEDTIRCRCGSYAVTLATNQSLRASMDKWGVSKKCLHRHEAEVEKRTLVKKAKLRSDLRKMGEDIVDIVRENVWMLALTLDTEEIHHIVNAIGDIVDAQKMRTLQRFKPEETKALFKSMGGRGIDV
jgi:CTP synthase (UTP-ammonia lyase)